MADEGKTEEQLWEDVQRERAGETQPPQEDPPETPPEPQDEQAQEQEAKPEKVYAELPPEVQAKLQQFDQIAASLPNVIQELREAKGRIGALQSQWQKAQATVAKPSESQVAAAAKDPEKWATIKKEYPDWGEAIEAFVETRVSGIPKTDGVSSEQIEQLIAQRTGEASAAVVKELNEKLVSVKHPDWRGQIASPEFGAWFQVQPPEIRQLAQSPDGMDAIKLLDVYAEHRKKPVEQVAESRQQRLTAAVTRPVRGSTGAVTKRVEDMTPDELWDYEARQRAKRAT